jgi:hypothetical protein
LRRCHPITLERSSGRLLVMNASIGRDIGRILKRNRGEKVNLKKLT